MQKLALVDFDHTLITIDSLGYIFKKERWYVHPALFLPGVILFLANRMKLPRKLQVPVRSRFKKNLLELYKKLNISQQNSYILFFRTKLNNKLVDHLKSTEYATIIVVSASEKQLIYEVLKGKLNVDIIIANDAGKLQQFRTCWYKEKLKRVQECLNLEEYQVDVYSDSYDDGPLIENAHVFYHIKKDNHYDIIKTTF